MHLWKPFQDKEIKHGSPLWRPAPPPPLGGAEVSNSITIVGKKIIFRTFIEKKEEKLYY